MLFRSDCGFHIDVPPRIYTLEQMKRHEHKQRFYLWDYLWWYGERWGQVRRTNRMDGSFLLYCYIVSLIILLLMFLSFRIFSDIAMIPTCHIFFSFHLIFMFCRSILICLHWQCLSSKNHESRWYAPKTYRHRYSTQ